MKEINSIDKGSLLEAILCTKLMGKAIYDFQNRDIRSFTQLKREIEMCYLVKRSTTHIQRGFNMLRQKSSESVREFSLRVDKLAMELYQSMVEGEQKGGTKKGDIRYYTGISIREFPTGIMRRNIDDRAFPELF